MNNFICRLIVKALFLGIPVILNGCTVRTADLTLVSTKNIDLSNASFDMKQGRRSEGESCAIALLGLIPLGIPNIEEAVDNALDKGKGNVMVDQVTYSSGVYLILATRSCIEVEGTVLNVNENK